MTDAGDDSLARTTRFRVVAIALSAIAVLVAGLTATYLRRGEGGNQAIASYVELQQPVELPDVVLTDTSGSPYDLREEGRGLVTLLYFGYLNCPDVCPIHMAVLGATFDTLPPEVRESTRVVFVTTDPERDAPADIRAFLDRFDPAFIGLTGNGDELRTAQVAAGVPVAVSEPADEDGDYLVGHATQVLVFEQDGFARRVYPFGVRQADWVDDLTALVERGSG